MPAIASKTESRFGSTRPGLPAIEFEKKCCVCEESIPNGTDCLMKTETRNIICMDCSLEIHHHFLKK